MPNFSVKMGFGLHVGWAIEGAIGSEFKIDASYLSPNVNMASRLEAATKQFGVQLLMSGQFFNILSKETQQEMRRIDRVGIKGNIKPVDLYTYDIDISNMKLEDIDLSKKSEDNSKKYYKSIKKQQRDELKKQVMNQERTIHSFFGEDEDIKMLRRNHNPKFDEIFNKGFKEYLDGDWKKAKKLFEDAKTLRNDGPCNRILNYMKNSNFVKPGGWGCSYL